MSRSTALIAAALWTACAAAEAGVVYSSGDFDPAQWSSTLVSFSSTTSALPTHVATAPASGGNGGSFWQHDFALERTTTPGEARVRFANIDTGFSYDPAAQGGISGLSLSYDLRGFASSFGDGTTAFMVPALAQGGHIYRAFAAPQADIRVIVGDNWRTLSYSSLLASDWTEQSTNATPDFSAAGGVLQFGYLFSVGALCNGSAGCLATSTRTGLDNFRVGVDSASAVPEPGTWALVLAGLAALLVRRRAPPARPGAAGHQAV